MMIGAEGEGVVVSLVKHLSTSATSMRLSRNTETRYSSSQQGLAAPGAISYGLTEAEKKSVQFPFAIRSAGSQSW